jgi:hypothetical protein
MNLMVADIQQCIIIAGTIKIISQLTGVGKSTFTFPHGYKHLLNQIFYGIGEEQDFLDI